MNVMKREWTEEELARGDELYEEYWDSVYWDDAEPDIKLLIDSVRCGSSLAALWLCDKMQEEGLHEIDDEVWEYCYQLSPDAEWMYSLGNHYHDAQRYELAAKWWRRAAKAGSVWGQFNLGLQYAEGTGVAQDWGWALYWYQRAADGGDDFAWCNLGNCYRLGNGVPQDGKKAYRLIKRSSDAGNKVARCLLGYMYCFGQGVRENGRKAFQYYQEALNMGNVDALNNLGYCYHRGIGCEKNDEKAVELFLRAIASGDKDCAAYNLAHRYRYGEGVDKDFAQAWKYLRMAAANGYALAFNGMGEMALKGEGLPKKNPAMALRYFRKGIKAGNPKECHAALARCYELGLGVKKNIRKAYEHLLAAQAEGYETSTRLSKRITSKAAAAGLL